MNYKTKTSAFTQMLASKRHKMENVIEHINAEYE
jgi:hypothetical protein